MFAETLDNSEHSMRLNPVAHSTQQLVNVVVILTRVVDTTVINNMYLSSLLQPEDRRSHSCRLSMQLCYLFIIHYQPNSMLRNLSS
jgi:hypothetical protein